jgi:hypothetical protein
MSKIVMPMVLRSHISPAVAAIACAHGGLAGYLRWKDDPLVREWISGVFYKRIYRASDLDMWSAVCRWPDALVLSESQLDHMPVIAIFKPCRWSPSLLFNELPLYSE